MKVGKLLRYLQNVNWKKGTKLRDNLENEYEVVVIGTYAFLKGKYGECKVHILTNPDRKNL